MQGLGSGIGIALVVTLVADIFPPAERAKWQSIFGSVYLVANLIGPTLGGWLTDHGPVLGTLVTEATRWHWIFYINLPVGMIALTMLLICLPVDLSERSQHVISWSAVRRIDFSGALLVAMATSCLLLGLTWGSDATSGWGTPLVLGILVAALVLYALFLFTESRVADPIVPPGLFHNRVFTAGALLTLLQGMVLLGLTIYLPLFLQKVLGVSATTSGAILTPMLVSATVGALLAGFAIGRLKRSQWIAILGAVVMSGGTFLLTQMTPSTSVWLATLSMVIAGSGLGVFFAMAPMAAQNALPRTQLGVGTAAVKYLGQLGPTLGVALVGTVVNSSLRLSLAVALQHGFWVVFVLSGATLLMTFFLKDVPMVRTRQSYVNRKYPLFHRELVPLAYLLISTPAFLSSRRSLRAKSAHSSSKLPPISTLKEPLALLSKL